MLLIERMDKLVKKKSLDFYDSVYWKEMVTGGENNNNGGKSEKFLPVAVFFIFKQFSGYLLFFQPW